MKYYPHVAVSTYAKQRNVSATSNDNSTALYAPICSDRGPDDKIVKINNLAQLYQTFGEPVWDDNLGHRELIYAANWLTNGGIVYVQRLTALKNKAKSAVYKESVIPAEYFEAKYHGSYYDSLKIEIYPIFKGEDELDESRTIVNIKDNKNIIIERFKLSDKNKINSEYIVIPKPETTLNITKESLEEDHIEVTFTAAQNTEVDTDEFGDMLVAEFGNKESDLYSKAMYPIDCILLNYKYHSKLKSKALTAFDKSVISNLGSLRDDVSIFIDEYDVETSFGSNLSNVYVYYKQNGIITDIYSGNEINNANACYYLSSMIPSNDELYGIQFPIAGERRGWIKGLKHIENNPNSTSKQKLYEAKINYIEKDSVNAYFMTQLTDSKEDYFTRTSLGYINNSRVKNKIVRDIKKIAKSYLFEFNDSITLNKLEAELNQYINQWIANRALTYADLVVEADDEIAQNVNVSLNIKFTGTIEIININITID